MVYLIRVKFIENLNLNQHRMSKRELICKYVKYLRMLCLSKYIYDNLHMPGKPIWLGKQGS